ncbi:aminotransferase class-V [Rhypophila sp. PSN 637]
MVGIEDGYPEYALTAQLDELRTTDYSYLDEQSHVYLDYTGAGLASKSQHQSHNERVTNNLYGNPHSVNPTSGAATEAIERARTRILAHVNASPDEYVVIFTANATAAARLVAESYPFTAKTKLVLTADNHNSINGIREFAKAKGTKTTYVPLTTPDLGVDEAALHAALSIPKKRSQIRDRLPKVKSWFSSLLTPCLGQRRKRLQPASTEVPSHHLPEARSPSPASSTTTLKPTRNVDSEKTIITTSSPPLDHQVPPASSRKAGLFAYPAQSNFSGVRHPLSYIPLAQKQGYHVLLDTAAYLPTSSLDLSPSSPYKPDFCILSFYKLFGTPTGVGALIARRDSLTTLLAPNRPWFSGGTITAVTVSTPWHNPIQSPQSIHEAFEDGTLNFLSIPDISVGLDFLTQRITLPILDIRIRCLTSWFLDRLSILSHSNGAPMAVIYGPTNTQEGVVAVNRGGTITFNLLTPTGQIIDERIIDTDSAKHGISLRTGCFCNPGAGEAAFRLAPQKIRNLVCTATTTTTGKKVSGGPGVAGEEKRLGMDDYIRLVGMQSGGAVRVSFGAASNTADVDRFFDFVERTYRDWNGTGAGEWLRPRGRW